MNRIRLSCTLFCANQRVHCRRSKEPPRFNRSGDVHADYARSVRSEGTDSAAALDRKAHDLPLSDAAARAITALREIKEESDGHARARDLEGIERAKRSGTGAINMAALADGDSLPTDSSPDSSDATSEDGGFCSTCFVPLVPDPRPEQLFIWLHAMRCRNPFRHPLSARVSLI